MEAEGVAGGEGVVDGGEGLGGYGEGLGEVRGGCFEVDGGGGGVGEVAAGVGWERGAVGKVDGDGEVVDVGHFGGCLNVYGGLGRNRRQGSLSSLLDGVLSGSSGGCRE